MEVYVNGKNIKTKSSTILKLLNELGIESKVMATALNTQIVKKEEWKTKEIKEGDEIEFLEFVGGG
ncbi:MAG: sulfur carrier protein ThiS [Campylobacterales bacterium]|nr:sulfur carrier protein ThiS [Campylobacterales bacterium]